MEEIKRNARALAEAVCRYADCRSGVRAIVDHKGPHTYAELWKDICACAQVLEELGLQKGGRIVMECTQDALFLAVNLSCQLIPAVFVGVERRAAPDRLREIAQQTDASVVLTRKSMEDLPGKNLAVKEFTALFEAARSAQEAKLQADASAMDRFREAALLAEPEEIVEILFSTGTTGKSKGAMLSNRANVANAQNIIDGTHMRQDTVELMPLPVNHAHGLRTSYAHLLNGSTVLIANGITFPRVLFDMMEQYGANAIDLTPSAAEMLTRTSAEKLRAFAPRIQYVEVGSAFLPETTKEKLRECFAGCHLYNCYGSSESGRTCNLDFSVDTDMPGCIGIPVPNARFAVMGPDGEPIRSDKEHTGLLASAGPMNMSGYWNEPELSVKTLRNGYVLTADLSYIDERGYIYVLGRQDDVIVYKGIKISPEEIEEAAAGCGLVADCACVPVRDEIAGQVPKLFVVPAKDREYSETELFEYLKKHIDDNRMPRTIELIDEIPRTYNGKVLRRELAAR